MVVKKESLSLWTAFIIPVVSVLVSVGAVIFAALAWRGSEDANRIGREALAIGKEANQLANSAHIDFDVDPDSDDQQVGFAIRSTGHGTAVLGRIEYIVDGQPATDLDSALTAANLDPDVNRGWYIEPGYLMAPGEFNWLLDYHSGDTAVNNRLADFVERVTIRVNYCSVTHECATACYPDITCSTPVSRAAPVSKKEIAPAAPSHHRHKKTRSSKP